MTSKRLDYALLLEQNGEGYNPDDNRTYKDAPLSMSPVTDITYHMGINETGKGSNYIDTLQGATFGAQSVQLTEKASNRVFFFPTTKNFSSKVITIKKKKLRTLYPASLIARYKMKESFSYYQSTPIFYDTSTDKFFVVMDERFLKDMTADEVLPDDSSNIKVYSSRKGEYLAITAESIKELELELTTKGLALSRLKEHYKRHFLNLQESERVIVVRFETENEETMESQVSSQFTIPNYSDKGDVFNLLMRQKMEFEVFQAAKIKNHFYLMNEDGVISPKAIIHFEESELDPNDRMKDLGLLGRGSLHKGGKTYVVMSYSEQDWMFIKSLQERLHSLCRELENFFLSTKTEQGLLDKPFSEGTLGNMGAALIEKK